MKIHLILLALVLVFSAKVAAGSSVIEARGYAQCSAELHESLADAGLVLEEQFQVAEKDRVHFFYLSGTAWADDGSRADISVVCKTDRNARTVMGVIVESAKSISRAGIIAAR